MRSGISFGVTSGVITTLGLMVGLHSGTHSKLVVVGGILTIAFADGMSDALGIHVSEESENVHTRRQIWLSTFATFFAKFAMTMTFLVPLFLFNLPAAIVISVLWGMGVLAMFSYKLAKSQDIRPWKVIMEHLMIALLVILITHFVGEWVGKRFG